MTTETAEKQELEACPFDVVGDNIVVELIEREEETDSGIVLVQENKTRPPEVVVVGAGPDAYVWSGEAETLLDIGMVLVVRKHELLRLELGEDGRELQVLKPSSIIGIMR